MTDFLTKHKELYLAELQDIASWIGHRNPDDIPDDVVKKCTVLIFKIGLDKDNIIKILNILSKTLPQETFNIFLHLSIEDYGNVIFLQKIYQLFRNEFIDFLLKELVEKNNESME
jgi:hypothetical protein